MLEKTIYIVCGRNQSQVALALEARLTGAFRLIRITFNRQAFEHESPDPAEAYRYLDLQKIDANAMVVICLGISATESFSLEEIVAANVTLTFSLARHFGSKFSSDVILLSSGNLLFDSRDAFPDPDFISIPSDPYLFSKLLLERMVKRHWQSQWGQIFVIRLAPFLNLNPSKNLMILFKLARLRITNLIPSDSGSRSIATPDVLAHLLLQISNSIGWDQRSCYQYRNCLFLNCTDHTFNVDQIYSWYGLTLGHREIGKFAKTFRRIFPQYSARLERFYGSTLRLKSSL